MKKIEKIGYILILVGIVVCVYFLVQFFPKSDGSSKHSILSESQTKEIYSEELEAPTDDSAKQLNSVKSPVERKNHFADSNKSLSEPSEEDINQANELRSKLQEEYMEKFDALNQRLVELDFDFGQLSVKLQELIAKNES